MNLKNGDCIKLMKEIPDKSVDLLICDLPYGETNCKWDTCIDMEEFWKEFKRIRKSKRVACIHFCSTKFGYSLIKSWEKGFKMDMVWKKRNKTGGLQSKHRPMRNHEMIYFFYEQSPKYNRDKYHKRIAPQKKHDINAECVYGNTSKMGPINNFNPPNPGSVIEASEKNKMWGYNKQATFDLPFFKDKNVKNQSFKPQLPASVLEENTIIEENTIMECKEFGTGKHYGYANGEPAGAKWEPVLPVSMFESEKVFIGKRNHQTEKPQDILEFFLKYWSDEGDTILDPTMGSGSTGVACKKLKRNFV